MPALDRPRTSDVPAPHVLERAEREQSRIKLLALAGDLADLDLRTRLLQAAPNRKPLLRVWNPRTQALGETVSCLRTGDGWGFHSHPSGPCLGSAEHVTAPGDPASVEAATEIAARIVAQRQP